MEELGFNMGDEEKTSQNTIANRAEHFKIRKFLTHVCQCQDHTCSNSLCFKINQQLRHPRDCKNRSSGKCDAYSIFLQLCTNHVKECKETKCPVPICATLKEKNKEKQGKSFQLAQRRIYQTNKLKPSPSSSVVLRNWHSEVNSDLRNNLIKKL